MWPFKNKTPTHSSFSVGTYKLNAPVDNLGGLVEFSNSEYAVITREFEGGKNFNAPPVFFLNREWHIQLGIVNNIIYKIAPYLLAHSKDEANTIAMQALQFCIQELEQPSEQKAGLFIWDTTDGNVILQTGETAEGWSISLFITSSGVRNFTLLKK